MEFLHDLSLQALRIFLAIALIFPLIIALVIASLNDRLRRIVLWIMVGVAAFCITLLFILLPRQNNSPDEWRALLESIRAGFFSAIPFLVVLIFFGLAYAMVGQYFVEIIQNKLHARIRRRYLDALYAALAPQVAGYISLTERVAVAERGGEFIRITGPAGSGKSILLKWMMVKQIRLAQQKADARLPIFIDLDDLPEVDLLEPRPRNLAPLQPVQVWGCNWMLKRQARQRGLIFYIDSSEQTFSTVFITPGQRATLLRALDGLVDYFAPCPIWLALPDSVRGSENESAASLERVLPGVQRLAPLTDAEATTLLLSWLEPAGSSRSHPLPIPDCAKLASELFSGGIWEQLARRPLILRWLANYHIQCNGRLPANLRELFRGALYPPALHPDLVEDVFTRLAQEMQRYRRYALPVDLVKRPPTRKADGRLSASDPMPTGKNLLEELLAATKRPSLLRLTEKQAPNQKDETEPCVEFAHPLYLSYFIALSWLDPQARPMQGGAESALAAIHQDAILAAALIFFNNIENDPARLNEMLAGLSAGSDDLSEYLVTQCLLAMPPAARPADLVHAAATRLVDELAQETEAGEPDLRPVVELLGGLPGPARLAVYQQAFSPLRQAQLARSLKRLSGPMPDIAREILWSADAHLARTVLLAWIDVDPTDAFALLRELYEQGPQPPNLALELLGCLPREAVEEYLFDRLRVDQAPSIRQGLLADLVKINTAPGVPAESTAAMLDVLIERAADPQEAEPVRVDAAHALETAQHPALLDPTRVREIVRVSLAPLPEAVRRPLGRLVERLRAALPGGVERWESVVNPYVIGRPIQQPEMLFGREAILQSLRASVESGNHVLLSGERRIGKTSILYGLRRLLNEEAASRGIGGAPAAGVPVRAALVDLQGLSASEFFETLIRAIIEQMREPGLYADPNVPRPYTDTAFERDLGDVLHVLHDRYGPQARLAVLIDEADTLLQYPPAMQSAVRRILTGSAARGLACIFSTAHPQRWQGAESPYYNLLAEVRVPRLAEADVQSLITRPVAGRFTYQPEAIALIQTAAQGKPFDIQSLCQQIINTRLTQGERHITVEAVQAALAPAATPRAELLAESETLLSEMMDWVEANPAARNDEVEAQLKQTFAALRETLVRQVIKMRKKA